MNSSLSAPLLCQYAYWLYLTTITLSSMYTIGSSCFEGIKTLWRRRTISSTSECLELISRHDFTVNGYDTHFNEFRGTASTRVSFNELNIKTAFLWLYFKWVRIFKLGEDGCFASSSYGFHTKTPPSTAMKSCSFEGTFGVILTVASITR